MRREERKEGGWAKMTMGLEIVGRRGIGREMTNDVGMGDDQRNMEDEHGTPRAASDDDAFRRRTLVGVEEREARSVFEDRVHALACARGALEVVLRADFWGEGFSVLGGDGLLGDFAERFDGWRVGAQVFLAADEQQGDGGRGVVGDFGMPLLLHVVKRVGGVDGEAEEDVGVGVGERAEAVGVLLVAGGVPQGEFDDGLGVVVVDDVHVHEVVLEGWGDVHLWERALGEGEEKRGLMVSSSSQ